MKKPVTYLGDAFFYLISVFSVICFIWILLTPAKYFVAGEIQKVFQNKGESRAINKYNELLAKNNITRENYKPSMILRKKTRELTIYANSIKIATYTVGLGRSSIGRKQNKDDLKTPEGSYYICNKEFSHKYHMFLQINYPSSEDAERARNSLLISNNDYINISQAETNGEQPPANTELGGNIGIHGFGSESSWTKDGSISMNNIDLEEVFWNIPVGCPIMILP